MIKAFLLFWSHKLKHLLNIFFIGTTWQVLIRNRLLRTRSDGFQKVVLLDLLVDVELLGMPILNQLAINLYYIFPPPITLNQRALLFFALREGLVLFLFLKLFLLSFLINEFICAYLLLDFFIALENINHFLIKWTIHKNCVITD